MRKFQIDYRQLLYLLPVVLVILLSRTVYFGIMNYDFYRLLFWFFSIACGLFFKISYKSVKRMLNVFIPLFILIIISMVANFAFSSISSYILILLSLFCCSFISLYIPKEYISKYYVYVILAFSIISIPCFIILNQFPNFALQLCQSGYDGESVFAYTWYYTFGRYGGLFNRNSGPFWEPGAFQGFIVIAMLMLLHNTDNSTIIHRKIILIIFLITLLTTQSTTGYIILILMCITCFQQIKDIFYVGSSKLFKRIMTALVILISIYIVISSGIIADKFSGIGNQDLSAGIRVNDIIGGIQMTFKGGMFGLGINRRDIYKAYYGILDDSSGLTSVFYTYGIVFGLVYVYYATKGIIGFFKCSKIYTKVSLLIIFLILFITEDLCFLPVYILIIFSGFQETNDSYNYDKPCD